MTALYAVIGNPIEHSKSPEIHQAFARQTHIQMEYTRILAEHNSFDDKLQAFQAAGGCGVNVTLPFKELAFSVCSELSEYARAAKAVNTILFKARDRWIGTNTDGIGLIQDIKQNLKLNIYGRRVLILGAGGATRGIIQPLLNEGVDRLVIVNRTVSRAKQLGSEFGIAGIGYEDLKDQQFDLIINATSTSLFNQLPPVPATILSRQCIAYDLVYANQPTAFMRWALGHGACTAVDGLGMLIEQAAAAFYFWHGVRPDTAPVIQLLRK